MVNTLMVLLSLAAPPAPRCLVSKPASAHLPDAVSVGKRFAITWYEPSKKGGLEQTVRLLEPEGELVGTSAREVTPEDGASSVMGRLAFDGKRLGLAWMDDASKERTAHFRMLDATGAPASPPVALTRAFLPHGDQVVVAWNPKLAAWGTVFTGTLRTDRPGYVTHHQYFVHFKGEPGAPVLLDADESVSSSHNLSLLAKGACFITAWVSSPTQHVVLGEVCDGKVQRRNVTEVPGKSPMQPSLASNGDEVLVTWADELPLKPAAPSSLPSSKGAAPSPFNAPPPPARESDVFFALLDAKGGVKASGTLPVTGLAQSPVARFDGTRWWVIWVEQRNGREAVLAARLCPDGQRQGELITMSDGLAGPVWVSFAGPNVLISQPNETTCVLSWAPLPN